MDHRSTRQWQHTRATVLATQPAICCECGKPIDLTLSGNHPDGPTVDHQQAMGLGGPHTTDNLRPAHRRCNTAKGLGPPKTTKHSRPW